MARKLNIPRSNLRYVLENPIYTGWRVYDERRDTSATGYVARSDGRQGYRRKIERTPDNVIRVHVLDGIVSEDEFVRVKRLIELNRQKHWRSRTGLSERYLFNGFLTCGECGELLYTHTSKQEFYICKTRHTRERRNRALRHLEPCTNKYMVRTKLESKINRLIGEKLRDSTFLSRVLEGYHQQLEDSPSLEASGVDRANVLQKLDALRDKKGRILDAFFEGVIDRIRRDDALQDVERDIVSYNQLLETSPSPPQSHSLPNLESTVKVIEPLADWEFLGRDDRRALLRQLCPEISVYRYTVKSLMLNLGAAPSKVDDRNTGSHSKTET